MDQGQAKPKSSFVPLANRPVTVLSIAAGLLLAGLWAGLRLPVEWIPSIELPQANVVAEWPGASPRSVEKSVTVPIESAMQGIVGTAGIQSFSLKGRSVVRLEVGAGQDFDLWVAEASDRLAFLRDALPTGVRPRLIPSSPPGFENSSELMILQLVGQTGPDQLRRLAEQVLSPELLRLPGVHRVALAGGIDRELVVVLSKDRLAVHGITPTDVHLRLAEALTDTHYGWIVNDGRASLLKTSAAHTFEELNQLVISSSTLSGIPLALADLAEVEIRPALHQSLSRVDGQNVVTLTLERAPGSDLLEVAKRVHQRLPTLNSRLPAEVRLSIADDRSDEVFDQLEDLAARGGLSLLLLAGTLLILLRSLRALVILFTHVAISLAGAAILLATLKITLNLFTLAGLVLVVGFLVDNGIIMVEQLLVERRRRSGTGQSSRNVDRIPASRALRAVSLPLLGGTLTTLAVLLPLLQLAGNLRDFFVPFGLVASSTLLVSLLAAWFLIPALGRSLPHLTRRRSRRWSKLALLPTNLAARYPRAVVATLILLHGVPLWLLPEKLDTADPAESRISRIAIDLYNETLGSDLVIRGRAALEPFLGGFLRLFVREAEIAEKTYLGQEDQLHIQLTAPPGGGIEYLDTLIEGLERTALASPIVRQTMVQGTGRTARMQIQFDLAALATDGPVAVRERLISQATRSAGIGVVITGLGPGAYFSGVGDAAVGIPVEVFSPRLESLEKLTDLFTAQMTSYPGVSQVAIDGPGQRSVDSQPVVHLRWDSDAVRRTGRSARWLANTLDVSRGRPPLELALSDGEQIPVKATVQGSEDLELEQLISSPLLTSAGPQARLANLAEVSLEHQVPLIERANQQYRRQLNVRFQGPAKLAEEVVDFGIDSMDLAPGDRLERPKTILQVEETQDQLLWAILAAIALVFLILAAILESWTLPWLVLSSLPMAALGVAIGFLGSGVALDEGALLGIVLLTGISVNNTLLLVYTYRSLRRRHTSRKRTLLGRIAVRRRLRPAWTTSLSSIAGMLPLVLLPEHGELGLGLAVTVISGILGATLLAPPMIVGFVALRRRRTV